MSLTIIARPESATSVPSKMVIAYRKLEELKVSSSYPRKLDRKQQRKFVKHLKTFGCLVPLVLDASETVIIGTEYLIAAGEAGLTELPVIMVTHLSREQLQTLEIAYIRLLQEGDWDQSKLRATFFELEAVGIGLELTGFDVPEIDLIINMPQIGIDADPADQTPVMLTSPVSRTGDIWQLGRHRVLCGSALDEHNYAALMGSERAAATFTDHPYNVVIGGNVGGLGAIKHREFAMAAGEMSDAEFRDFLLISMSHIAKFTVPGAVMYFCMDWRHGRELHDAALGAGLVVLNRCTWVKPSGGMGSFYRSRHEDVYVCRNGNTSHCNNVELGRYGRNRTNVWEYASPASFGRVGEEGRLLDLHPTVKPVAMVQDAILDCTARGEIVLDPFLGSGTTIIAAEKVGRCCFGMELDPLYVDTIIRRWQAWTGDNAILTSTRQTFTEIPAQREIADV